jgi:hypothetical protein
METAEQNRRYFMKRMTFSAITVCLLLITTAGGGVLAAPQKLPPPYRVMQYDVTYKDEVVGKLSVNTNEWTYGLNAYGLEPDTNYYFYYQGWFPQIAIKTTNAAGNLHLQGAWDPQMVNVADLSLAPKFILRDMPLMGNTWYTYIDAKCCNPLYLWLTVWGQLYYLSEDEKIGIPDQTITIYAYDKDTGSYSKVFGTVTTDSNGEFSVTKAFSAPKYGPMVSFTGNTERSYSFTYADLEPFCPIN